MYTPLMKSIQKYAFLHALGVVAYVSGVAWFMNNAERLFGGQQNPGWFGGVLFLLLFVISAAITGSLVFGRPVLWYLDGKKGPAVHLAVKTVLWLAIFLVAGVIVLTLR